MELILSAISAGGLIGAANQYACLLIVSIAARTRIITLAPNMDFIASYWFMGLIAFLWLITIAPTFSALLSPGLGNIINTVSNFISGFLVPVSSALLSLSAIGVIVNLNPDLEQFLETLRLLTSTGEVGAAGYAVAVASAGSAAALTGIRGFSKPAVSSAAGTTGTISAPIYSLLENVAAVILMVAAYLLAKLNPWLLVALFGLVTFSILALFVYAIYQLIRLKKGIGRVLDISQKHPRAGLAIFAEFFIWGSGWFAWKQWGRGFIMLFLLALWIIAFILLQPIFVAAFSFFPPVMPLIGGLSILLLLIIFALIGFYSAKILLRNIEEKWLPGEKDEKSEIKKKPQLDEN